VSGINGRFRSLGRSRILRWRWCSTAWTAASARWTNTQSEFGAQYDSIADMVGVRAAPALVAYEWTLKDLGTGGLDRRFHLLRRDRHPSRALQRQHQRGRDKRYFQGLAQPLGARR